MPIKFLWKSSVPRLDLGFRLDPLSRYVSFGASNRVLQISSSLPDLTSHEDIPDISVLYSYTHISTEELQV